MARLLLFSIMLLAASDACAETKVVSADIREDFSDSVDVSGMIVAGAFVGKLETISDPGKLLLLPPNNTKKLCLSARTRDGRYWAEGSVDVPEGTQSVRLSRKGGWQYVSKLKNYKTGDFAALARLSDQCETAANAPILPVQLSLIPEKSLSLAVNSQRAISISAIMTHAGGSVDGNCTKSNDGQRSAAFNFWCQFDLAPTRPGESVSITINRRMRVGPRSDTVDVVLP
jgi:hypothetical protein